MIRKYLRSRRWVWFCAAALFLFFPAVCLLFGVQMQPVYYTELVGVLALGITVTGDFLRFLERVRRLEMLAGLSSVRPGDLPEPRSYEDELYRRLIAALCEEIERNGERIASDASERMEYYTLWLHQVKTPISALRLLSQRDGGRPEYENELFAIERYVDMALQYVRLGELENDLVIDKCTLRPVVSDCLRRYSTQFIGRHISVGLEDLDRTVVTDSRWLAFIVEQLLSNAVKYTPPGGTVTITGGERRLCISDTGIGIPARDLPRIFEKCYTGAAGRLDRRSSGIGLYLAKRVASALSITLEAASEEGRGTSMTLLFPEEAWAAGITKL